MHSGQNRCDKELFYLYKLQEDGNGSAFFSYALSRVWTQQTAKGNGW